MPETCELTFDVFVFSRRFKIIQDFLKDSQKLNGASVISFILGNDEVVTYNKTAAMQEWLFGYDLQETLVLIGESSGIIVTGKKKANFLNAISESLLNVEILSRNRDENYLDRFPELLKKIGFDVSNSENILGVFEKDKFQGSFTESWYQFLERSKFKKTDVSVNCALFLAQKDSNEIENIKLASNVCSEIYTRFLKPRLLDIIDDEKTVTHNKLTVEIEESIDNKKYHVPGIDESELEVCFPPIVQSGGKYNVKFSASSDKNKLEFDCIVSYLGIRYKYYCSSLVRTLMVQPSEELKKLYSFILTLYDLLQKTLKPGVMFCDVYNTLNSCVKQTFPNYADNFVRNIGFVSGLEFRELSLLLDSKCTAIVQKNMIFCILIAFQNVKVKDYTSLACVAIGDTVHVNNDGVFNILTTPKRNLGSASILLNTQPVNNVVLITDEDLKNAPAIVKNKKRKPQQEAQINEEQRKAHQATLRAKLNEEARNRLVSENTSGLKKQFPSPQGTEVSYASPADLPNTNEVLDLFPVVDTSSETVIIPIFGCAVPYHISSIKSASVNTEGGHIYIRINFLILSSSLSKTEDLSISYGKNVFLKELILRSSVDRQHVFTKILTKIKELQKSYRQRVLEASEMSNVVEQVPLILNVSKVIPRLKDLSIRPQITNRRVLGTLETHTNGLRYISSRGERVDIIYNNIDHAFFQPPEEETIIALHFRLKSPIIIGKRKFKDVQFCTEIGEAVSDLGRITNSSMLERDEIEAEESERELRNRLKASFKGFMEKTEAASGRIFEFEVPFRELGFYGVPFRSTVFLVPTTRCLINLIETPPFVVVLDEIELVHFERVAFQMKNFDMVIVFKDYRRKVVNIGAISMSYLDPIKDWLDSCDIKYTESTQNLNWPKIMKTILDDPEEFFATGGWTFLDPDSDSDAKEENSEDEDAEYKPESSEEEVVESSESDSEDYESEASDSAGSSEYEESESGKSWAELEEEARAFDAMKQGELTSPRKRKSTTFQSASKRKRQ